MSMTVYLGWERPRAPRDDGTKAPWHLCRAWAERKGGAGLAAAFKADPKRDPQIEACYTSTEAVAPPGDGRWGLTWPGRPDSENGHDVEESPGELERTRALTRRQADEIAALKAKLAALAPKEEQ